MDRSTLRALGLVSGLGFAIAIPLGLCFLGGLWLDTRFGTRPLFMLLGIGLGLGLAILTIKDLLAFQGGGSGRLFRRRLRPDSPRAESTETTEKED